uniref:18.3 kDa family n=1 Tax=Rhipicephalus zambeziensis TaxID=60191 RepID=A0A224YBI7_9ACAR
MSPLGPTAILIGSLAGTLAVVWHSTSDYTSNYGSFRIAAWPKLYCYRMTYVPGHGLEYRYHPEGTPCWLTLIPNRVGYCNQGICRANNTSGVPSCTDLYNGNLFTKPRRAIAGMCKRGMCVSLYELSFEEQRLVHPHQLHRCPEKEHSGRNVLSSCYHYCQIHGAWYHGYYSSNRSSSCNLGVPRPNRRLGWCCQGRCIEMPHCYAS